MAGMPRKQIEALLTHAEQHGCTVHPVKNGFMVRFPDGGQTTIHMTTSDVNVERNVRAKFKRHGIPWPKGGRAHPMKQTIQAGDRAMRKLGHPDSVQAMQLVQASGGAISTVAARSYLLNHLGYVHTGATRNSRYLKPATIETVPVLTWSDPEEAPQEAPQEAPEEALPAPLPAPEEAPEDEHREFLDTADSWTVDLSTLPPGLTMEDLATIYTAAGLQVEVRVWRIGH